MWMKVVDLFQTLHRKHIFDLHGVAGRRRCVFDILGDHFVSWVIIPDRTDITPKLVINSLNFGPFIYTTFSKSVTTLRQCTTTRELTINPLAISHNIHRFRYITHNIQHVKFSMHFFGIIDEFRPLETEIKGDELVKCIAKIFQVLFELLGLHFAIGSKTTAGPFSSTSSVEVDKWFTAVLQ